MLIQGIEHFLLNSARPGQVKQIGVSQFDNFGDAFACFRRRFRPPLAQASIKFLNKCVHWHKSFYCILPSQNRQQRLFVRRSCDGCFGRWSRGLRCLRRDRRIYQPLAHRNHHTLRQLFD